MEKSVLIWSILCVMKWKYGLRILLIWLGLYLGIVYFDGISLEPIQYGILPSFVLLFLVFAAVELLLYPIMKMLILPLRVLTLGFATAVLSVNLVYIIAFLLPFFVVSSLWEAAALGVGIGFVRLLTK